MIKWQEVTVDVRKLKPYPNNPRYITEDEFNRLVESIQNHGYNQRIMITKDLFVVSGHQRMKALILLGYEQIPVLMADSDLTDREFEVILLQSNHNNGLFNMDTLANAFEMDVISESGIRSFSNVFADPFGLGEDEKPEDKKGGGREVICPCCSERFPVKGNGAKA